MVLRNSFKLFCVFGLVAISKLFAISCSSNSRSQSDNIPMAIDGENLGEPVAPVGGHEYVDLGLSVKWGTMNIGAVSPSDYGDFFAWGETEPKDSYTPYNCKTYKKGISVMSGKPQYDVATARWGGSWRIPTREEYRELMNMCTKQWVDGIDVDGYLFTSKVNGNTIFFPAAGMYDGEMGYVKGNEAGYYWTSTSISGDGTSAMNIRFWEDKSYFDFGGYNRFVGLSVRAVTE